jgi:hypothetical protein
MRSCAQQDTNIFIQKEGGINLTMSLSNNDVQWRSVYCILFHFEKKESSPEIPAWMDERPLYSECLGRLAATAAAAAIQDVGNAEMDQEVGGQHTMASHGTIRPRRSISTHFISTIC